ncbi:MAG: hypothetical protein NT033_08440 [Candidatus Omnitrophica bacterium]|nr:hypothetical protein [Candidatus Omnitrophota bacterium]
MVRITVLAVIMCVALGMVGMIIPAYSEQPVEPQQVASVITTEIVSVDLDKSTLALSVAHDPNVNASGKLTISVMPETKILNGDQVLKLSDLKAGDKVTVKYTTDASGTWKVESISLQPVEPASIAK